MNVMSIGRMRTYLELQQPINSKDEMNADTSGKTWAKVRNVWAAVEPLSGKELVVAQQISAEIQYKITIRGMIGKTDSIRSTYRFHDNKRNVSFNIAAPPKPLFYTQDTRIELLCVIDNHFGEDNDG